VLAALRLPSQPRVVVEESLDELGRLAESAGARVVGRATQDRRAPTPGLYFGKGKVEEIKTLSKREGADLMISDDSLSPIQERNLGGSLGVRVIDRTALILDIFAQRARTMEGKLQVELAQLSYLLPRLVGQWKHLERTGGGIGTRGPGEMQIESDRRIIRHRIQKIRDELQRVRVHRRLLRDRRKASGVPVVALVGYTNAGKTTLLNHLTGADRVAADALFVTLDPTARLVTSPTHASFILTDTVGFIRKLPHHLVASFRSTLEEAADADLLLEVVDAGSDAVSDHLKTTRDTLRDLGLADRPRLTVFNKIDRVPPPILARLRAEHPDAVFISALEAVHADRLETRLRAALQRAEGEAAPALTREPVAIAAGRDAS
jgi:GTPase